MSLKETDDGKSKPGIQVRQDHDDLCLVPGCENKGDLRYPCIEYVPVRRKLGYYCEDHGKTAPKSVHAQGRLAH